MGIKGLRFYMKYKIMLEKNEVESLVSLYQVQMGLYRNKNYADRLLVELLQNRYPAYMECDNQGYYVVKVGNYLEFQEAIDREQQLKQDGYETIIVTA